MIKVIGQGGHINSIDFDPFECEICGCGFVGIWSDLNGQAMCTNCGAPYYLRKYESAPDVTPPELALNKEFAEVFKEYWEETGEKAYLGTIIIPRDYPHYEEQLEKLTDWLKERYPKYVS